MDVSQYLDIFIDESSEHIQTLSDCIMTLEQEPENKDTINEIFRAAHSLKGMAGTMGFKRMQHLTHDMENVFQEVRSDKIKVDSSMIDLLFKCLDAIDSYVENIKSTSDEGTDDNEVIIKELNDFIAKANGQTVSKQAEPQEKAAEAETKDSSDASDSALDTIELTNNEKNLIDEAISAGLKIYGMTVTVASDCLLKAARAFLVFKAVEELGQILVYRPSSQDIEDEKFDCHSAFMLHQARDLINWSMQLPTYLRLIRLREKKSPSFTWRVKQSRQHRLLKRQKRQIRKKKRKRLLLQRQNLQSQKLQITLKSRLFLIKKLLQAEQSE